MRRVSPRLLLLALAIALAAAALAPVAGASVSGDDAEGEVTIMDREGRDPPRNLTLTLRFVANDTGEPVADLPLEILNRWTPPGEKRGGSDSWDRTTDGNGTVTLNASRGPVRVAVDDPSWKRFRASFRLDGNLTLELPLRPNEEPLARVGGTVTSEDGAPLPNATIEVDPARECQEKRCPVQREAEGAATQVTVNGTEVHLRWRSHDGTSHVEAGEDGSYEVALPEGPYRFEVRAPDHLRHVTEVGAELREGHATDFQLTPIPPDSVTLQGVIRDATTGEPIEGAVVTVENPKWDSHDRVRAGEDGTYEVTTKPGHLVVEARAEPGGQVCIMAQAGGPAGGHEDRASTAVARPEPDCEPHAGPDQAYLPRSRGLQAQARETRNLSLALQPEPEPTATIQGWVLDDATGEPLPNATVHLVNEETGDWGKAPVDANGSFSAQVPAGYHTVRVHAPGHLENATNVVVDEGGTAEVVLRAPAGEPAGQGRCCYVLDTGWSEGQADGGSGDGSAASPSGDEGRDRRSGEATIQGQPGGLGPYDASASGGRPTSAAQTPAPGSAALVATLLGAAALGRRLRGR